MAPTSPYSDTVSLSSSSSSSSSWHGDSIGTSAFFSRIADTVRDKVEAKKLEINATMQEKLPEWKMRGAMYGNLARETGIEWSRKGKEAVDRWKKELAERDSQGTRHDTLTVFGMPLKEAVALTKIDEDDKYPAVFRRCIEYLEAHGLKEIGIYRIPGSTSAVNKLRAVFDTGSDLDLEIVRPDPHVVGALLKMYLRELPQPLIPEEIARQYNSSGISASEDNTSRQALTEMDPSLITSAVIQSVRCVTANLPEHNLSLLRRLCEHLKHVADHENENRMSTSNLAVVFLPTLGISRIIFHCMVDHHRAVFAPPVPTKPRHIQSSYRPQPSEPVLRKHHHQPKTRSDTDIMAIANNNNPHRVPPAKPHRSSPTAKPVSSSVSSSTVRLQIPPTIQPITTSSLKPRSKSVSTPSTQQPMLHPAAPWRRAGGKVEAIGRQFESIWNQSNKNA